jgi:hypothetical protein
MRDIWMMADEEVREEMCDEYDCDDADLNQKELERRVEIRYESKCEEMRERVAYARGIRNESLAHQRETGLQIKRMGRET